MGFLRVEEKRPDLLLQNGGGDQAQIQAVQSDFPADCSLALAERLGYDQVLVLSSVYFGGDFASH